jgi:hypothetical protein
MEADRTDFETAKTHILSSSGVALATVAIVTLMPNEIHNFKVLSVAFVGAAGSLISSLFRVTFSSLGIRRPGAEDLGWVNRTAEALSLLNLFDAVFVFVWLGYHPGVSATAARLASMAPDQSV